MDPSSWTYYRLNQQAAASDAAAASAGLQSTFPTQNFLLAHQLR